MMKMVFLSLVVYEDVIDKDNHIFLGEVQNVIHDPLESRTTCYPIRHDFIIKTTVMCLECRLVFFSFLKFGLIEATSHVQTSETTSTMQFIENFINNR
jgi:hypothetical protein